MLLIHIDAKYMGITRGAGPGPKSLPLGLDGAAVEALERYTGEIMASPARRLLLEHYERLIRSLEEPRRTLAHRPQPDTAKSPSGVDEAWSSP